MTAKNEIGIGLLGMGTVGRGVYRILNDNKDDIEQKIGASIVIKKILVRDISKDRGLEISSDLLTTKIGRAHV